MLKLSLQSSSEEMSIEELQIELQRSILNFDTKIETFQRRGSGWVIKNMDKIELEIVHADYFKSTGSFSELPDKLKSKRCLIKTVWKCLKYFMLAF